MFRELCLKTIRRSMGKTLLLGLLMAMLTVFFILGISMYVNSKSLLKQADASYTSVGFMEYTGIGYPDEESMNESTYNIIKNKDLDEVVKQEEVLAYHPVYLMRGNVEGQQLGNFYNNPYYNYSVIKFKIMYATEDGMYRCLLLDTFSGQEYMEGKTFGLSQEALANPEQFQFEKDHIYIGHGDFRTEHMLMVFCPVEYEGSVDQDSPALAIKEFPLVDITDQPDYMENGGEGDYWQQIIDFYKVQEGSYRMLATDDLNTYKDFYIGTRQMIEGRYWTDKEETAGDKVCIIDQATAKNGYEIGDEIPLRIHYDTDGSHPECSYDSREGFKQEDNYTVIGIYEQKTSDLERYIFIPSGSLDSYPTGQYHYYMGCVELKNGSISDYTKATRADWINHFDVYTFDQGYMATVEPINAMLHNAILIIVLCGVASIAVMVLFAILFIVKQRESIAIMTALGTGKRNIRKFLLYGSGIIAGGGCVVGSIISYFISEQVVSLAYTMAKNQYSRDLSYSSMAMGIQKLFKGELHGSIWISLMVGVILFIAEMILSIYYANQTIEGTMNFGGQTKKIKKKLRGSKQKEILKDKEEHPIANSTYVNSYHYHKKQFGERQFSLINKIKFVIRQSTRSLVRNRRVAVVLLLVTGSLSLFMIFFAEGIERYQNSLEQAYKEHQVDAYYTTLTGAPFNAHNVTDEMLDTLKQSACVETTYVSTAVKYEYVTKITGKLSDDNTVLVDALKAGLQQGEIPNTGFARERRVGQIYGDPDLIMTDKLERTEEFFNEIPPKITYESQGEPLWDEKGSNLKNEKAKTYVVSGKLLDSKEDVSVTMLSAVVNSQCLRDWNVDLGDDVLILQMYVEDRWNSFQIKPIVLHIAGSYVGILGENIIYTPTQEGALVMELPSYGRMGTYSVEPTPTTINYHLTNLKKLDLLRKDLKDLKIGSVGELSSSRICFVIDDKELIENVTNLQNNISFMEALKYVLFVLVFVIGFVAAYLTMRTRHEEIAIIRSQGTGTVRTFLMFFIEQMLVGLVGVLLSLVISWFIFGQLKISDLSIIALFYVIYMLGCGICIGRMNKKNVLAILSAAE